jgi:dienelactone hydrolase
VRTYTLAELQALEAELGPTDGPIVAFAAATGLPAARGLALERGDVKRNRRVPGGVMRGRPPHTPDLFDGRTFPSIDEGVAYASEVGFGDLIERGVREADQLPNEVIYAGFSLGVLPAQKLAQTRPGAAGALLFYSCVPMSEFGPSSWPAGVPVQIHGMDADPYFVEEGDIDAAREVVDSAEQGELFLYPGDQHYFADSSLPSYDPKATALLTERVLDFLRAR